MIVHECVHVCVFVHARACLFVNDVNAETWPRSMRGATHPWPENTSFLATQCCRSDEKQTERKSETKKTRGELHECKTKIRATASS